MKHFDLRKTIKKNTDCTSIKSISTFLDPIGLIFDTFFFSVETYTSTKKCF